MTPPWIRPCLGEKNKSILNQVKQELSKKFDIKVPMYIASLSGCNSELSEGISISQPMYTEKFLHKFDMHNSKLVSSPVNHDVKLTTCENPDDMYNQRLYEAVVGSLLYLINETRPDIAFALSSAAWFCTSPTKYYAI